MAEAQTGHVARLVDARWLLVAAVACWALVAFYLAHWGSNWALDLRVYRAAGHSLYDDGRPYTEQFTIHHLAFTYPPFALLALSPLSLGPLWAIKAFWWLVNEAALVGVLSVIVGRLFSMPARRVLAVAAATGAVATLALEPLRSNLDYGQINVLLMLLVVVDLLKVRGRGRGVLCGVAAAIKLTPLVYLAFFFVQRDLRSTARGIVTFFTLSALSWLVLPSGSWLYWRHEAFSPSRTGHPGLVSNQSWNGIVHRVPFHAGSTGVALWAAAFVLTAAVGVLAAKWLLALGRALDALVALTMTELLISPISWSHHWSWVVLAPPLLVKRWRGDRAVAAGLVALLVVAAAAPYWWSVRGWPGALLADSLTLAGAALLVVLARQARVALRVAPSPAAAAGAPGPGELRTGRGGGSCATRW